jgi:hypothetical protein
MQHSTSCSHKSDAACTCVARFAYHHHHHVVCCSFCISMCIDAVLALCWRCCCYRRVTTHVPPYCAVFDAPHDVTIRWPQSLHNLLNSAWPTHSLCVSAVYQGGTSPAPSGLFSRLWVERFTTHSYYNSCCWLCQYGNAHHWLRKPWTHCCQSQNMALPSAALCTDEPCDCMCCTIRHRALRHGAHFCCSAAAKFARMCSGYRYRHSSHSQYDWL